MGNAEAKRDFPDQDQRLAFCHSVYDDARNTVTFITAIQAGTEPHQEELMGREYLVVPAVLVQGQVLNNNLGVVLLPPSTITEEWADEWNGAPVIIHEHPTSRGQAVSARTPEILDARGVGMVFRAKVDTDAEGVVRLKGEVWLEKARAEQVGELAGILNRLQSGEQVELSTGFPVMTIDGVGVFNGRPYDKIMQPQGVDHLAIFIDRTGACSVQDGCGLGVHAEQEESDVLAVDKEERGLMLRVLAHLLPARNAGDAVTDTSLTPCEQKKVATGNEFRLLIRRLKAQGLNNVEIGAACGRCPTTIGQVERGEILHPAEDALAKLKEFARERLADNQDRSDEENRKLLDEALESAFGGTGKFLWIDATFADQKRVIFGLVKENPGGVQETLFEVTYELATDEKEITFAEPTEVERRVIYESVANTAANKEEQMKDKDKGEDGTAPDPDKGKDGAAANAGTGTPAGAGEPKGEGKPAGKTAPATPAADPAKGEGAEATANAANAELVALRETVAAQESAIEELKAITAPAVAEAEKERKVLVDELSANEQVPFDAAALEAKPVDELRKLAAMSRGVSYAGRGGPRVAETAAAGDQFMAPVAYFEKKEKKEGEE